MKSQLNREAYGTKLKERDYRTSDKAMHSKDVKNVL